MISIDEKRVYGDREGALAAYVASAVGVVRVRVSDENVGEFGLVERCEARDVAAGVDAVAVATDEDVLAADRAGDDDPAFEPTGFGPATAVGFHDGAVLAASADGRVARFDGDGWDNLAADPDLTVRAIDGDLVATAAGVYRVRDGGLDHAGLSDATDVSAAGVPLAATGDGLYRLGNGWMAVREGAFDLVAAEPLAEPGRLARAHAVAGGDWYRHADGAWRETSAPADGVAGVSYGESATYAVAEDGTFAARSDVDAGEREWRSHPLGVRSVTALAVPTARVEA
ncbi:HVO_0234 family beta-propeller protein [Salinilacihabitans rarus]|uniref:HVO_0234 family beta-propeller protein n=1 Tax=Salinilacihabitans rarus TaxID=2961596 RepID=UPI0020C83788|nr:hypothetical protein [Salinilacihabitans rarus]